MKRYDVLLVILAVVALFVVFDYRLGAGDFKIYTGCNSWRYFRDADSCGFGGLRSVGFTEADLDTNSLYYGFDLFPILGVWARRDSFRFAERWSERWLHSRSFWFEAEGRSRYGQLMQGFSFFRNEELDSVVGIDVYDRKASNDWARTGSGESEESGYLVRGLREKAE
jgi:hypothetical protein